MNNLNHKKRQSTFRKWLRLFSILIYNVQETIILPTNEITKPTELGVYGMEEPMRDSGVVAGSPDDKAEAADLLLEDEGREADYELARDLLDEPDDEVRTILTLHLKPENT